MHCLFERVCLLLTCFWLCGCGKAGSWHESSAKADEPRISRAVSSEHTSAWLEITGTTAPAHGHISEIATVVIHPVVRVLVQPGDTVEAGQPLIELDADEPEAEVRAKQAEVGELTASVARLKAMPRAEERAQARAELESAQISHQSARSHMERLTSLRTHDAVSLRHYHEQKAAHLRAEADERAAQARLDYLLKQPIEHEIAEAQAKLAAAQAMLEAAEAELEHYVVHASISGIVCWLDVMPGTVTRPGTKTWGEIVDPRVMDVRVELTPKQLSQIDRSAPIEVVHTPTGKTSEARLTFVSPAANRQSGGIPILARISNEQEPWPCHLEVTVRFKTLTGEKPQRVAERAAAASASQSAE